MNRMAFNTARGPRLALGAAVIAFLGGAALMSDPASAGDGQATVSDAVNRGASATLETVRRRVFVAPAYGYDPYYGGPDYYAAPVAPYVPPVAYPPPVAYEPVPPVDYDYDYAPGPGFAIAGPRGGVVVGY
jgi:hypothetical protein